VYPPSFNLLTPKSLEEALEMLAKYGSESKLLAGGQSLIPLLKLRLTKPKYIIYLGKLRELSYVEERADYIAVGALTTHFEIERSEILASKCPLLSEVASKIGDLQVRNMGTIGGSLAHADPAADYPAALTALEAEVVIRSLKETRVVKVSDLIKGVYTTDLRPDEMIVEVRVPRLGGRVGTAYEKLAFRATDYAIVGVAAVLELDQEGRARRVRLGLTGVSDKPIRPRGVEEELEGKLVNEDLIVKASKKASEGLNPPSDIRASSEYRRAMAEVLAKRALLRAFKATSM
jgi:carbon-monoxide dehydrogenase medium subunit